MSHASSSVRTSSKRFPRAWWIAGLVASCVHAAPTLQNSRPENVIAATLRCRQGDGPWQEFQDAIFPYEFSPEFDENAGDLQLEFLLENARQEMLRAPGLTLSP